MVRPLSSTLLFSLLACSHPGLDRGPNPSLEPEPREERTERTEHHDPREDLLGAPDGDVEGSEDAPLGALEVLPSPEDPNVLEVWWVNSTAQPLAHEFANGHCGPAVIPLQVVHPGGHTLDLDHRPAPGTLDWCLGWPQPEGPVVAPAGGRVRVHTIDALHQRMAIAGLAADYPGAYVDRIPMTTGRYRFALQTSAGTLTAQFDLELPYDPQQRASPWVRAEGEAHVCEVDFGYAVFRCGAPDHDPAGWAWGVLPASHTGLYDQLSALAQSEDRPDEGPVVLQFQDGPQRSTDFRGPADAPLQSIVHSILELSATEG